MHYQCLIVDDEKPLAQSTEEYFNLFNVTCKAVFDAPACLDFFKHHTADLILLDINLKESSGFELCRQLRKEISVPILFISARNSDDDILLALNIGGDDYIRKPYSLSVLLAKVKAVLKRYSSAKTTADIFEIDNFMINFNSHEVKVGQEPIKLKALEYKLLAYLVINRGKVLKKEELFENVWQDTITSDGTLNVHIRHLREKIEKDPNHPQLIQTVWGVGYRFKEEQK